MKERKRSLLVFVVTLLLCGIFAVVTHFLGDIKSKFQQKTIPSPLLSYGETGKILRELDVILPLEDKRSLSGFAPNTVDFAKRAARERNKWLLLQNYQKYSDSAIFCYIEMESSEVEVPFSLYSKIDGKWKVIADSRVRPKRVAYPFFIKDNSEVVDIHLRFSNKLSPVKISGIAFFQKGYHPLIYTDPIAFNSFFRKGDPGRAIINLYGIELPRTEDTNQLLGRVSFQKKTISGISNYQKKQGNTQVTLIAKKDHPLLKSIRIMDSDLAQLSKDKITVLAIDVEDSDLYSKEYGILTNFDEHGRRWERLSYSRLFRDGKSVFSNFSGVRLQGGDPGREKGLINFRLFFREEYGKSMIEGSRLFNGSAGNIKRLAVKQSEWPKWPLNSPIAYDVSRQLGVLAPPTELVLLYLNGEELGLYYIVPHLGEKQIKNMLPDNDYKYCRIRGNQHYTDKKFIVRDFFKKLSSDEAMSEEFARQFFDIENLTRQVFSYMVNATGDYCQGITLKGKSPGSKMFWYSWDMDHSYVDVPVDIKKLNIAKRERWQQPPGIKLGLFKRKPGQKKHHCARLRLFRRLTNEDPIFREKTKHFFASMMNHQITDEFVTTLLDQHQQKLQAIAYPGGDEYIGVLRDFFKHREGFLFEEMQRYFPAEPPSTCFISSNSYPVVVDGFTKTGPYEGKYFPGATLSLGSTIKNQIKYWRINGEIVQSSSTSIEIQSGQQCEIEAVH